MALRNNEEAMADFDDAEKLDLGAMIDRLEAAIEVLQNEATTEAAKQKIVSDMVETWRAFDAATTTKDAARTAMFAAAVAYEKLVTAEPDYATDDADDAYDAAVDEANTVASDLMTMTATMNSFATYATAMAQLQLDANGREIVTWGAGTPTAPTESAYDARVAAIATNAALYTKAEALVEAYDKWYDATLTSDKNAAWDELVAAYGKITADDKDLMDSLADWTTAFPGCTASAQTAYWAVAKANTAADQALVANAKAAVNAWLTAGNTWDDVSGTDLTADDIEAELLAQVQAILDADTAHDYSGLTVSIPAGVGTWDDAIALGATVDRVFRIVFTAGAESDYITGQHVDLTNNYSAASLEAAVKAIVEGTKYWANSGSLSAYESAVVTIITTDPTVENVLTADEVDVTITLLGTNTSAGSALQITVTVDDEIGSFTFTVTEVFTA